MGPIMVVDLVRLILFPTIMAFAASSDLLTMTISNRVSIVLVGGFFALALMTGMGMAEVLSHTGAAAVVLVVSFGFFTRGWIGGGDAKLAAATAMWLGFGYLMNYLVYASLLAGQYWAQRLHRQDGDVPYGIALAAAALLVYPDTPWMKVVGM
jgi:prepilin peptidase CpaA